MEKDPSAEVFTSSEVTVKVAKKELGKILDYTFNSLQDLDVLVRYTKKHFNQLKNDGKLTEQTVQRASISIGSYLGEVIRRKYGGNWIAKNTLMKTLVINEFEVSPILFIYQQLTNRDLDFSLDSYLSEITQKMRIHERKEDASSLVEITKKIANSLSNNKPLVKGAVIGVVVMGIIGILCITIYSGIANLSPTSTPHINATRNLATSAPSLIKREPLNYLQNLPGGYVVNDSIVSKDVTLGDGTRLFDVALTNKQAFNHGDLLSVQYFVTFYPSESKAISEYYKYILDLAGQENGVLDSEIEIEGADDSGMYVSYQDDNLLEGQYSSRVKNVVITTVGLTIYDPRTLTESILISFMADVAKIHALGINNTR